MLKLPRRTLTVLLHQKKYQYLLPQSLRNIWVYPKIHPWLCLSCLNLCPGVNTSLVCHFVRQSQLNLLASPQVSSYLSKPFLSQLWSKCSQNVVIWRCMNGFSQHAGFTGFYLGFLQPSTSHCCAYKLPVKHLSCYPRYFKQSRTCTDMRT